MSIQEYLKMGETLFAQGSIADAEEKFLHVLEVEPENKQALNNLGVIAFGRGDIEKSKAFLMQAIDHDPLYLDALINLCEVLQSTGSLAEALPLIDRAISMKPEDGRLVGVLRDVGLEPTENGNLLEKDQEDSIRNSHGDSGTCPRERPLRVIHLPLVIANTAIALSKYLNRIDVDSKVISYFRTWLNYEGDINLELDNLSPADRNKRVAAFVDDFLKNEAHKYDIFHFHFFDSLSTGASFGGWRSHPEREPYWDLEYIKSLGKKIVVTSWGSDVRNNSKVIFSQLQYEQASPGIPYMPLNRKDQYSKIWAFALFADAIVQSDTEVLNHAPYGTMIPMPIDLEPLDILERENRTSDARLSIVYAPSNHFLKGTAYVDKVLKKIIERYGSVIDIRRIHGIPHKEALKQYLGTGITIDQIGSFSFGMLALESLYLGRTVFTSLRNEEFMGFDPKLKAPVVPVYNEKDFLNKIFSRIESGNPDSGQEYKQFVRENFAADVVSRQYRTLYEKLMAGERIEHYVSQEWSREFSLMISSKKVDVRDYYPKVTDLLIARGDFEKLAFEVQMGLGLNDDTELLAKYVLAMEMSGRNEEGEVLRKNNRSVLSTKEFRKHYKRAQGLFPKQ